MFVYFSTVRTVALRSIITSGLRQCYWFSRSSSSFGGPEVKARQLSHARSEGGHWLTESRSNIWHFKAHEEVVSVFSELQ